MTEINKNRKMLRGNVISDKMQRTIVVEVERTYMDPSLNKVMRTVKKYKVHDEDEKAQLGDVVEIYEGRPVSKTKYMYLASVISSRAK